MSHQLHKTNLKNRQTSAANSCEIKMKNIILGAVSALLLGTTTGLAADLPVKAPPPVVIYDWTGFYIGVSGGGSLGGSNHVDPNGVNLTADGFNVKGGLVGGTVGYNWQISRFVLGFEGDMSWVGE
jgi:outer membrane immunogenic protein